MTTKKTTTKTTKKSAVKQKTTRAIIEIPALNEKVLMLKIVGDTPLITHKWSEKQKRQIRDKQAKKANNAKEARDPWQEFCESMYWLSEMPMTPTEEDIKEAKFGFKSIALKDAAVTACTSVTGVTKIAARQSFHVVGEFLEIKSDPPYMREDAVRIGMGTSDLRYRGCFENWSITFKVRYNADLLSAEQLVHLFNIAGFAVGLGEWRPEKNGQNGMFHVDRK